MSGLNLAVLSQSLLTTAFFVLFGLSWSGLSDSLLLATSMVGGSHHLPNVLPNNNDFQICALRSAWPLQATLPAFFLGGSHRDNVVMQSLQGRHNFATVLRVPERHQCQILLQPRGREHQSRQPHNCWLWTIIFEIVAVSFGGHLPIGCLSCWNATQRKEDLPSSPTTARTGTSKVATHDVTISLLAWQAGLPKCCVRPIHPLGHGMSGAWL